MFSYFTKRTYRARAVVLSQLQRAGATQEDFKNVEEFAAGAYRIMRAVRDQATDEKIAILTQAMLGLARRHDLWPSEFVRVADFLAPLSRDELIFIGALMRIEHETTGATEN